MTILDLLEKIVIPLIAACIGAILAFRYQHNFELNRDKRAIIQNLMIYRNVGAYELDWIKALNAIDIVFSNDQRVRELYHTFLAQTKPPTFNNLQYIETFYQLVHEMAQCSGYKKLTMHDIRDFYSPGALVQHYPNMNVGSEPIPPTTITESEKN
ncbi:hypothetical protein I2I11_10745 [Pontibacter sp. 172403-2]|uniref:DUF6680 family protein n=1 Tax=Pontibacter rufus TaxID=2791028 RepID=UPI0018B00BFD|nr:DUF6680 family protein [Pontibacter sp. 172403-2]MBF9253772.1 hypothetical protein [Pontibacter sp. 172403-2]